jgi:hypothetical protein
MSETEYFRTLSTKLSLVKGQQRIRKEKSYIYIRKLPRACAYVYQTEQRKVRYEAASVESPSNQCYVIVCALSHDMNVEWLHTPIGLLTAIVISHTHLEYSPSPSSIVRQLNHTTWIFSSLLFTVWIHFRRSIRIFGNCIVKWSQASQQLIVQVDSRVQEPSNSELIFRITQKCTCCNRFRFYSPWTRFKAVPDLRPSILWSNAMCPFGL